MKTTGINKTLVAAIIALGLAPAFSALAEPRSFDELSFRQDRASAETGDVTRVFYTIGHSKYRHHRTSLAEPAVDTETAAFEEVEAAQRFTRPLRPDRIPR